MARIEYVTYHERILVGCEIAEMFTRWRWCRFEKCTIRLNIAGQIFESCECVDCKFVPSSGSHGG